MKFKVLSMLGVLAFSAGTVIQAQDYDDIYYDGSSNTKVATEKRTTRVSTTAMQVPARYKVTVQKNYQVDRDVDEYNRRGDYADAYADTLAYNPADADVFSNTERIERFYNPDIVVLSDDPELVELYFDSRPSINLVIGSNYGYVPHVGWGWGYGSYWYDPWYSIYDPFYRPWGWYGWYGWSRPYFSWGWSWGWHRPWYYAGYGWGWGRSWYAGRGWDRPGWNHHGWGWNGDGRRYHAGAGGRRPGDHRSMLDGSTNHRYTSRAGAGSSGVGRAGSVTNGRQRPSAYGSGYRSGATTNRQRPSSTVGNTDSYNRGSGWSGGSVRNRGTSSQSSGYSSSPSRTRSTSGYSSGSSSSRSYSSGSSSRSYSSGSSSRSYSSGSSSSHSYSGGGYSGGSSRGGGGFSGGGGHSGGGGGGGHRR